MLRIPALLIVFLILTIFLQGCSCDRISNYKDSEIMEKITENDWIKLSGKRYFFGHKSVGNNIMDGITDLLNESNFTGFEILEITSASNLESTVFAHGSIGENGNPISKIDAFVSMLSSGLADSVDIAFMKFCYVDIRKHTDIEEIFNYYQNSIRSVQLAHPDLKIIHFTVPLKVKPLGIKGLARIILDMDDNKYRNRFNELIRDTYPENELFDIARLEARYPDNTYNIYWIKRPGLIADYSSDGGHLNEKGRLIIARELIHKLLNN